MNADVSKAELLAFNRNSFHPVYPWVARARFRNAWRLPENYLAGLRASDGRWLSLICGRRRDATTFVDWQMHLKTTTSISTGIAMRAFFIEHEVGLGSTAMTFEHGTSHPMNHAFKEEDADARRPLTAKALYCLASHYPNKSNVLAGTILSKDMRWLEKDRDSRAVIAYHLDQQE